MTAKEVLQNIEKQREEAGIAFLGNIYFEVPEYREVINALEKQIPKKPTVKKSCKVNAFALRCPNCEAVLQSDSPHCKYCGQALDWSDEE